MDVVHVFSLLRHGFAYLLFFTDWVGLIGALLYGGVDVRVD